MVSRTGLSLAVMSVVFTLSFARCQTDLEYAKEHAIDAGTQLCPGFGRLRNYEFCRQNRACFSSTGNVNNRNMLVIRSAQGVVEVHRRAEIERFGENANDFDRQEEITKYLELYRLFCGAEPDFKEDLPYFRRQRAEQAQRERVEAERRREKEANARERAEYEAKLARARAASLTTLGPGSVYCQSRDLVEAFALARSQGGNGAEGLLLVGACREVDSTIQVRMVYGPDEAGWVEFELQEAFYWTRRPPQ